MAVLTRHLQRAFLAHCPRGWTFTPEAPLVDPAAARRLGFDARADGLFEQAATGRRLWVEFEVSRADPVANHAKFATARHLEPWPGEEAFVSMASRAIEPGRYALAAGAAMLMRGFGIPAFQTSLLPGLDGDAIRRVNQARSGDPGGDRAAGLDMAAEVARAMRVGEALGVHGGHRIHKADNALAVGANVRRWNLDVGNADGAQAWGRRRVANLVRDGASGLFAPAKFAAFVPAAALAGPRPAAWPMQPPRWPPTSAMTIPLYASLGESDPRFDGHIAWRHLTDTLGYRRLALDDADPALRCDVHHWLDRQADVVVLRRPAWVLVPPVELRGRRRGAASALG